MSQMNRENKFGTCSCRSGKGGTGFCISLGVRASSWNVAGEGRDCRSAILPTLKRKVPQIELQNENRNER